MRLRLARPADGAGLEAIYRPVVAETWISFEWDRPSAEEMALRVDHTLPTHPWLVAEDGGIWGYAYAGPYAGRESYRWSTYVSVYIHPEARGQGLGRSLSTALFALLHRQGFHRAFAGIALPNAVSVALHESVGFSLIGVYERVGWKLGGWRDVAHWQRTLAEVAGPPGPVRAVDELTPEELETALERGA